MYIHKLLSLTDRLSFALSSEPSLYEQEAAFAQQLDEDGYKKIIEKHQDLSDLGTVYGAIVPHVQMKPQFDLARVCSLTSDV